MQVFEISLENLRFKSIIGILDFERQKEQDLRIDAKFSYEFRGDFLDYRLLKDLILSAFKQNFDTLENALLYLKQAIQKEFKNINKFEIKLTKLEIFKDCLVSLKIDCER